MNYAAAVEVWDWLQLAQPVDWAQLSYWRWSDVSGSNDV